jgi:hypothetical protein
MLQEKKQNPEEKITFSSEGWCWALSLNLWVALPPQSALSGWMLRDGEECN